MADVTGYDDSSPFDTLAAEYDAWFEGDGKLPFAIELEALRGVLPLLPKPWLEVGVGSGRFAQALGMEVGVDPSLRLLEAARDRGIAVVRAWGEELPFKKETFGTVFLIVALCFVDSPAAVLQEVQRVLKPGGRVVLGLVLRGNPWGDLYLIKKMQGHSFYRHAVFYSYQDVEELLVDSGFTIEKIVSTLFQKPGEVKELEVPKEGILIDAGFTVIVAGKPSYSAAS